MKRDLFGEQQPENFADIVEVVSETGFVPITATCSVTFASDPDPTNRFNGWSATVDGQDDDGMDVSFTTCGYQDKEVLLADLRAVGFRVIMDEEGKSL